MYKGLMEAPRRDQFSLDGEKGGSREASQGWQGFLSREGWKDIVHGASRNKSTGAHTRPHVWGLLSTLAQSGFLFSQTQSTGSLHIYFLYLLLIIKH